MDAFPFTGCEEGGVCWALSAHSSSFLWGWGWHQMSLMMEMTSSVPLHLSHTHQLELTGKVCFNVYEY